MVPLAHNRLPRWYAAASGLEDTSSMEIDFVKDLLWNAEVVLDEKEWGEGWSLDVIWILCVHTNGAIAGKDLDCTTGNICLVYMLCMILLTDTWLRAQQGVDMFPRLRQR